MQTHPSLLVLLLALSMGCASPMPADPQAPDSPAEPWSALLGTADRNDLGAHTRLQIPDVQGLELDVTVHVSVEGPLATVALDLHVTNHGSAAAEAVVFVSLPSDAAVHGLALDLDGQLVRGELVDRDAGTAAYDAITEQRRDPALLTEVGDGLHQLRVFPVPGREQKPDRESFR